MDPLQRLQYRSTVYVLIFFFYIIHYTHLDDYSKALLHSKHAEDTSNMESEEDGSAPRKRTKRNLDFPPETDNELHGKATIALAMQLLYAYNNVEIFH